MFGRYRRRVFLVAAAKRVRKLDQGGAAGPRENSDCDNDLKKSPLRVGLAATVTVDTTSRDGPVLAQQGRG